MLSSLARSGAGAPDRFARSWLGGDALVRSVMDDCPFVDIHCHLLPGIDDGADDWDESLAMARIAAADGIRTTVVTPHQCGAFSRNRADEICRRTTQLSRLLHQHEIPLEVLPGADVRIEPDLPQRIRTGDVLTLGDHGRHVLLELPHELYFPLDKLLGQLQAIGVVGILSHPERNAGLLDDRRLIEPLVGAGCLMQITASSLCGAFGPASQQLCEWMLGQDLVHFVSTDAHGALQRRPRLSQAFQRVAALTDHNRAERLFRANPQCVARGQTVAIESPSQPRRRSPWLGLRAG